MLGGDLLPLPVHPGGLAVVDLHPVHSDVALARARVAGDDAGQGNEAAAVVRPALEDGELVQIELVAAAVLVRMQDDLLAGSLLTADGLGKGAGQRAQLRQHFELVDEALRGFKVHQGLNALGNLVQPFDAQGQRHAPLAAELVDEDLVAGMALDVLEEQGRTAGRVAFCAGLHMGAGCRMGLGVHFRNAVGDLGDFQLRRNLCADAFQFAVLFEGFDPVAQVVVSQGVAPGGRFFPLHTTAFGCRKKLPG